MRRAAPSDARGREGTSPSPTARPGPDDGGSLQSRLQYSAHAGPSAPPPRRGPPEGREEPRGAGAKRGARDQASGRRPHPAEPLAGGEPDPSLRAQRRAYNAFVPGKGSGVYNAVVLGAGTAGLVAAAGTAGLGGRVALVERHRMGGDCLNTGCVPSKPLLSSARAADAIRHADRHGLEPEEPRFDFSRVLAHMRERRAALAPNDSQERFESLGVDVFRGQARFVSPHEVVVTGADGKEEARLYGRNFVIATGSGPTIPRIEGLDSVPYYTNETVFDELPGNPGRLAILGGGPCGCELGQAFAR